MSTAYVALLRGINVGGNNIVPMKALKASFEDLGFDHVSTWIASGNVLFRAREKDARRVEQKIDRMLESEYGVPGRTVVRTHAEMKKLLATIDRTWKKTSDDWRYYVLFLHHSVDSKRVLDGIEAKPGIEEVVYCPGSLLWRARIADLTRSGVQKIARMPIYRDLTIRNLNTTRKVFELMEAMQS